jgi:thiaminase (transcriptional activator TenA)
MSYGATFLLLRDKAGAHWSAYTQHEFVLRLADGSLPRAAYLRYLIQDYLFLVQYGRVWALAVTKADSLADMRLCAATVQRLIGTEIRLHIETCAAAGLSEADLAAAEEALETIAYTRFVLDAGHSGDFLDLLVAVAPCAFGYGEIGARLSAGPHDAAYAEWIQSYASAGYQALCHDLASLLDRTIARRLGKDPTSHPRWTGLCAGFTTATKLEAAFWQMGLQT